MQAKQSGPKIIFMGSPDFSCPTLQRLIESGYEIVHVLTQPPRAKGRGMAEQKTAVAQLAQSHDISVSWPTSLKSADEIARIAAFQADLFIVVAYGLILPKAILDLPALGALNGHASLLPRWRGAAPIQRAIEAGDDKTGSCAMMMEEGLDTGPVIHHATTNIRQDDTAASLHDRLANLTADVVSKAIDKLVAGTAEAIPQSDEGITYAAKIQKAEAALDVTKDAMSLTRHIHAFAPFPGAFLIGDTGQRFKCLLARAEEGLHQAQAGTYLGQSDDGALLLACGKSSILALRHVQPSGKKPMNAADFLRGKPLEIGKLLQAQI